MTEWPGPEHAADVVSEASSQVQGFMWVVQVHLQGLTLVAF